MRSALELAFAAEEYVRKCQLRKAIVEGRIQILIERRLRGEGCAAHELLKEKLQELHEKEMARVTHWEGVCAEYWKSWESEVTQGSGG